MRALHVGLIGYGMAGRVFHAPMIAAVPELRLAKVVERRGHPLAGLSQQGEFDSHAKARCFFFRCEAPPFPNTRRRFSFGR